jgi:phosphoglycerate dehydrogenase-like enzyme
MRAPLAGTEALVADHAALVERLNAHPIADPFSDEPPAPLEAKTAPDKVWACPHCTHDL